jgi:16S rRNA (cytosine1402-N4)-methyltransferase
MYSGSVRQSAERGNPRVRGSGGTGGGKPAEGHTPVMIEEAIALLAPHPGGVWVDATLGGGGHAERILRETSPDGILVGVDKDEQAIARCRERLAVYGDRFRPFKADFADLKTVLDRAGLGGADGVLADLGTSSFQLDEAERGFSFGKPGPVDMRMDREAPRTAMKMIEEMTERGLAEVISRYGEERSAPAVARAIKKALAAGAIKDTVSLAEVVSKAAWKRGGINPATRTFQALRIAVNDELGSLEAFLKSVPGMLRPGGRAVVISFHSLEDRTVKAALRELAAGCRCPSDLPVCACGRTSMGRLLTSGAIMASESEIEANPRSRSARLRGIELN